MRDSKFSVPYCIAVDFDGTLCTEKFPEMGEPKWEVIAEVLRAQQEGKKIILWTCRYGERLAEAVEWCKQHGLHFDAVNENLPERVEYFGYDCRKIGANEYWDDRARKII